jgi:anti-sigma factor RsiW
MSKQEESATERLSAYLDGELTPAEAQVLETQLARDRHTRERLEGLRRVVDGLRQAEPPPAPPPTLHHAVARHIAIERDRTSFLDRMEQSLSPLRRYNPVLPMFALVISLSLAVYFLSVLFARAERAETAVVLVGAETEGEGGHVVGDRIEVAGRALHWTGALWRQRGVVGEATREVLLESRQGRDWLDQHPELVSLATLDAPALILLADERILVRPPP